MSVSKPDSYEPNTDAVCEEPLCHKSTDMVAKNAVRDQGRMDNKREPLIQCRGLMSFSSCPESGRKLSSSAFSESVSIAAYDAVCDMAIVS